MAILLNEQDTVVKPVLTTKHRRNGENGNCLAAAIASVLEITINDIPMFEEMTKNTWKNALFEWAGCIGIEVKFTNERPDGFAIGVGIHNSGECHAVVVHNGEFCFDTNGTDMFYPKHNYYLSIVKSVK
jgi:hypothetical protein